MIEAALSYARAGLAVLPLHWIQPNGVCSCGEPKDKKPCKPGKHPLGALVPHGVSEATTNETTVRTWWTRYPLANIGIAAGEVSGGFYWLDFDEDAERVYHGWLNTLSSSLAELPFAVVQTGRGYRAAWRVSGDVDLKSDPNIARSAATADHPKGMLLVESRGNGGYGIAPPSVHANGRIFTLLRGDLCALPVLSPDDHARLLRVVKTFNAYQEKPQAVPLAVLKGGAFGGSVQTPTAQQRAGGGPEVDWPELWRRLDLSALAALLRELDPRPHGAGYLEVRCPACGIERRAFVYPSNGTQGVAVQCNRSNNCANRVSLMDYLTSREGSTAAAVRCMLEAAGMDTTPPTSSFSGARSAPSPPAAAPHSEPLRPVPPDSAPVLDMVVAASVPQPASYRLRDSIWEGPSVERLSVGLCASCGWHGVPLLVQGQESRCPLCYEADQRDEGQPMECSTFCDPGQSPLLRQSRFEPGGLLACPACATKMRRLRATMRQQMASVQERQATG